MTDPLTQGKLDEVHNQLEAHRRVNGQNLERMRLVVHNQKKQLEAISLSNKLEIEKLSKGNQRLFIVGGLCLVLVGVLVYVNLRLQTRFDRLEGTVQSIVVSSTSEMTRMKTKFQDLEQEQFETDRQLDRTRKNMDSP
jgi:hypothetical protein